MAKSKKEKLLEALNNQITNLDEFRDIFLHLGKTEKYAHLTNIEVEQQHISISRGKVSYDGQEIKGATGKQYYLVVDMRTNQTSIIDSSLGYDAIATTLNKDYRTKNALRSFEYASIHQCSYNMIQQVKGMFTIHDKKVA